MNYYLVSKIYLILCWMFFILLLLVIPIYSSGEESYFTVYDKVFHFFVFGILAGLINWSFHDQQKIKKGNFYLVVFVFTLVYILVLEHIQSFIPTRAPSWWDAVSGLAGGIVGMLFVNNYLPLRRIKK